MQCARLFLCCLPLLACVGSRSVIRPEDRGPVLFTVTHPSKPEASLALLGTVQLERADFRLDRAVERAIDGADQLFIENGASASELMREAVRLGTLPDGQTARDVLTPGTWALLEKECTRLKVDPARLSRFKPWLIGLTISEVSTRQPGVGMRDTLDLGHRVSTMVRAKNKPIEPLETPTRRLELLSSGDQATQDARLATTLERLSKPEPAKARYAAFEAGDLGALEKLLLESDDQSQHLAEGNVAMFEKLASSFGTPTRQLVLLEAVHLLGDSGLVRLFERGGYGVERVKSEGPGSPWVAPWVAVKGAGFSLSFPGQPSRLGKEAGPTVLLWQGDAVTFTVEITHEQDLATAIEKKRAGISRVHTITMSETVEFAGRTALHLRSTGSPVEVNSETWIVDSGDAMYSLTALSSGPSTAIPQQDFDRFFKSFAFAP